MTAAMDGITTRAGLETLLRRLSLLGGFEAAVGILQLLTGQTLVQYLHLPGLTDSGASAELISRGAFIRPAGTASHPIEFGVALAMLLPIALHFAVADAGRRSAFARWLPAGLIALALSLSISRSAIICTAIALPVLLTAWPRNLRRWVYVAAPTLIACLTVTMPGFYGTVMGMFTGIGNDSSAQSRTGSYGLAWSFIARAPVFGRGVGTFLPPYRSGQPVPRVVDQLGFVGWPASRWRRRPHLLATAQAAGRRERMPVGGAPKPWAGPRAGASDSLCSPPPRRCHLGAWSASPSSTPGVPNDSRSSSPARLCRRAAGWSSKATCRRRAWLLRAQDGRSC
jgi:hypothetical protein